MSLAELLEAAWQRSPHARLFDARGDVAYAQRTAAESLLAGPPSLGLANRNDRFTERRGKWENEIELSAPVWLPGQRDARLAAAEADLARNDAAAGAARLALAGELRTRVWDAIGAGDELALARERLEFARSLEADVVRRVAAGEVARRDALLAGAETLAAQTAVAETETRRARALERLRLLTGDERLPDEAREPVRERAASHPRLAAAERGVERARAHLRVARESRRESPEIGVQYRRDRDAYGEPSRDTFAFAVKIPLATEARNRPLIAAAQAELAEADGEQWLAQATLESEEREALLALEAADRVAALAERRLAAVAEAAALVRKAFDLGEASLAELLRVLAATREAQLDLARAGAAKGFATARVNQSRGVLP
ncbi:MAG: TolC family protein [Burkholderiales bacterium]|nr:TolC family protein [Burkholderiales bacterium]